MAVSALLRSTEVTVAPGASARCHVLIRNNAAVVDQFVFAVMGDIVEWTEVRPQRVNLMPNQEVTVELTFSPPKSYEVLAGNHPFALKVSSREDEAGSVVQEGVVTVTKYAEIAADIVPKTSEGRRVGKHVLAIDNLGNHEYVGEVSATDPDNKLTFKIRPHGPPLSPGHCTFVKIKARPKRYFWKGQDRVLPFQVRVLVPTLAPTEIDAAMKQGPLLPRRLFWLFSILLMLLVILILLFTMILRQRPVSIAGPAPSAPSSLEELGSGSQLPSSSAATGSGSSIAVTSGSGSSSGTGGTGGSGGGGSVAAAFTIRPSAYPGVAGGPQLFSFVVPEGKKYQVTSVLLHNTEDDVGDLEIRYNDKVLATFSLADVRAAPNNQITHKFTSPPTAKAGELITMAITCRNPENPCTTTGAFSASIVA
jgi:hypothetical protein